MVEIIYKNLGTDCNGSESFDCSCVDCRVKKKKLEGQYPADNMNRFNPEYYFNPRNETRKDDPNL